MKHLKGFGIKNFRIFKEHTWFDFAPITLLVGPNNSGKSSLTKGLFSFKNFLQGDVSFKNDEDFLQLGSFERVLNNNSNNEIMTFSTIYTLKHYPTLGEEKDIKILFDLESNTSQITISKIYLELDGNLLFEIDSQNRKSRFNIRLFNTHLIIDDTKIKVKDDKIVDIMQPRINLGDSLSGNIVLGKELFTDKKNDLKEVIKIYSDKKYSIEEFIEIPLEYTLKVSNGNEDEFFEEEYQQTVENSLRVLLLKSGYNNDQVNFIDEHIFRWIANFNNDYLARWKTLINHLEYHTNLKNNTQRIYRRIENDSFNNLLTAFFEKNISDNESSFFKRSGEIFNLQGEIKPIFDKKYDIQTLEVSGLPLVEQGFGISQIVALLLRIVTIQSRGTWGGKVTTLICEEPEANLHPGFQSKLADMFVDAQRTFNHQFIIETHSEYMIRKFQYLVAKGKMKKEDIVIYYFNDPNNIPAGEKQVKKIEILEDGSLSDDFGSGFLDEADNLAINLFNLQNCKN